MVDLLVRRRLLYATRVGGTLLIRHREVDTLRRIHDPSYRDPALTDPAETP